MIEDYVNKLIENLPHENKRCQKINLILDGGAFNGSYLVGALYFLKEMERRKYVKIDKISGCSVGSIVGFLYFIDSLDLMPKLYDLVKNDFRNNFSLNIIKTLKKQLEGRIPDDIFLKVNGKLFICYNDIKRNKKIVKNHYKNVDDLIDTIIKSCYIPFLIDKNMLYKKKYIDGINAYIFKNEPDKKNLHMELLGYNKIFHSLNIKNEKSNFHRILEGLLDIHCFYIKKTNTDMCSFVEEWNIFNKFHHSLKLLLEKIIVYFLLFLNAIKKYLPKEINNNIIYKILSKIGHEIFIIILDTYCL
jgi:uncharacterized membrane protein required for colicin V production